MAEENDYSKLSGQIGDLGGEQTPEQPLAGKKLKRVGHTKELSESEQDSMKQFLESSKRARRESGSTFAQPDSFGEIKNGWIPLDKSEMGRRAQFYPEDWQFRIKTIPVDNIKNWSAIDDNETRDTTQLQFDMNQVFNEIVQSTVSIVTPSGNLNWKSINSHDRFWFIEKAREYTYMSGNRLEFTDVCSECGSEMTFSVHSSTLCYDLPDDEVIEKHWDNASKTWIIDPKEYDLDAEEIKLYFPTLGKDDAIFQWAYAMRQAGKTINRTFMDFLPWMLKTAPNDAKLLDKAIKECERKYKTWDQDMFSFMSEVIRNIKLNPSEQVTSVCPCCGAEVRSTVQFPDGIKSLFPMESRHKKFGTK